mgnify:CR=1 FL=1
MSAKEIEKVFQYIEDNFNKQKQFDLKMEDRNQITAYFKETNKRFCQFYINAIIEIIGWEE